MKHASSLIVMDASQISCVSVSPTRAVSNINRYNTGHSEAIITKDYDEAQKFLNEVDAACVYVNASTRFTDGNEFGFGAENNATPETWSKVPMQDFTPQSDIDWTKSIPEIDRQLYAKYGLDEQEIAFIEEKVKAME